MRKIGRISVSLGFSLAVWLFWYFAFPYVLSFKEQNQLFIYTWDYLWESLSVAGGFAGYLSGFLLQFAVIRSLGALAMTFVTAGMQVLLWRLCCRKGSGVSFVLSFVPSVLSILYLGDIYALPALPVAIVMALGACVLFDAHPGKAVAVAGIPALLWLAGPAAWIFVVFVCFRKFRPLAAAVCFLYSVALVAVAWLAMGQYPLKDVVFGISYYSVPLEHPLLQHLSIAAAALLPLVRTNANHSRLHEPVAAGVLGLLVVGGAALSLPKCYNRNICQLISFDQLVRAELWDNVISEAKKYQPKTDAGCVSVNLSLFMTGRFDQMERFYQCGVHGLLMPRVRDYISNTSTCEAFWRLGFVNEALRYAFDSQEANPTHQKSGRWLSRMAECQILNGRYKVASKYLDILKHTLFYRRWATEEEKYLYNGDAVLQNPMYAYLQTVRPVDDYLYYYPNMENMLGNLYFRNNNNIMAGEYCLAWRKLTEYEKNTEDADSPAHGN